MAQAQDPNQQDKHPGMMGDGTEEQNLNQTGNPGARIKEDEVREAFKDQKDQGGQSARQ